MVQTGTHQGNRFPDFGERKDRARNRRRCYAFPMEHLVSGLVGGTTGGLIVLLGLVLVLRRLFRANPDAICSLSMETTEPYREVRVVDHEHRIGGIWIRLQNEGKHLAMAPRFKIDLYESNRLVAQHELCGHDVPPAQTSEQVLSLRDAEENPIGLEGLRYELKFLDATCRPSSG